MQPITAAQPAAPNDGLAGVVGVGVIIPDTDDLDPGGRWPRGFQLEGLAACAGGYTTAVTCETNGQADRSNRRRYQVADPARAFSIGAGIECSTFGGNRDLARWNSEARDELERVRWTRIAHEMWTGTISTDHQRLASPDATVLSADPVSPVEAVAALEDAMGTTSIGRTDLLHFPRKATPYLAKHGQIVSPTATSGRLYTYNGSLVVADRGYPGTGPEGQEPTATVVWAYATGIISARLGPIATQAVELNEAVDMQTNDMAVRAEQPVAIGWLCAHYAIPVALPCETATQPLT